MFFIKFPSRGRINSMINYYQQHIAGYISKLLRTILIVRKVILIRIEKEFIRLGHGELMRHYDADVVCQSLAYNSSSMRADGSGLLTR